MSKRCSNCGFKLEESNPDFCSNCGKKISQTKSLSTEKKEIKRFSVNDLGSKFEQCVEAILKAKGYDTKRCHKIKGISGAEHEIDIIAIKGKTAVFVECKNWKDAVGKEQLQEFHSTLQDLAQVGRGVFASCSGFTSDAEDFAAYYSIERWDPDFLKEELFAISTRRAQYAKAEQKLRIKNALPITCGFADVIKLNLYNDSFVSTSGLLTYHPYFIVTYSYKSVFKDPTEKTHRFKDDGQVFIDGLDASALNPRSFSVGGVLNNLVSKEARVESKRNEKLIWDLQNFGALVEYDVRGEEKCEVRLFEPAVFYRAILGAAKEYIIDKNTVAVRYTTEEQEDEFLEVAKSVTYIPKSNQIVIKSISLVNLPRFDIRFVAGGREYSREVLAFSGTVLEDTLKYCSEHLGLLKKKAVAVCEICGDALCEKHIHKCPVCNKWLCEEHGIYCHSCRQLFCREHISLKGYIYSQPLCESCQVNCQICGRTFGKLYSANCTECGKLVCPDCSVVKGVIRKKTYCKECTT